MRRVVDVVVVGAGHAGCEAAGAAARKGASTLLLTLSHDNIGQMSCNPSFGGIGKGQLMREVDALDGLSARIADQSAITYQALNRSHGPAVVGLRAQIDRAAFMRNMQREVLHETPKLKVRECSVEALDVVEDAFGKKRVVGVFLGNGERVLAGSVVIATGTFLGAQIFYGMKRIAAGRIGEKNAMGLSRSLASLSLSLSRLRTGTPPRLKRSSIRLDAFTLMPPDEEPIPFSFLTEPSSIDTHKQLPTYRGETNDEVRQIVEQNLHVNEHIRADTNGPRYCPSLEAKIIRFPLLKHRIFLEHEGIHSDVMYPQGLSMTFEVDTQRKILRCIPGLEKVELVQAGYGVQYDFVDPRQLDETLEVKSVKGLFLAGQINGTTGYEEAAAQGVLAGANAAISAGSSSAAPLIIRRDEGYLGVLIDDLTTLGTNEPYRMFSSRAEFRLHLRSDNADIRLTEKGQAAGIVGPKRWKEFSALKHHLDCLRSILQGKTLSVSAWSKLLPEVSISPKSKVLSAYDILHRHGVTVERLSQVLPELDPFKERKDLERRLAVEGTYSVMNKRMMNKIEEVRREGELRLPEDLDFSKMQGLSEESMEKLDRARPLSLAAASRVQGVTPEAILTILRYLRRTKTATKGIGGALET